MMAATNSSPIIIERQASFAIVTLNRPEKLNALSRKTITALSEAFAAFVADESLRAIILTGAGDRAFCAGTDISELVDTAPEQARDIAERGQHLCDQIEQTPIPVIAAINGIAAGGGCELALASHLRVAANNATLSLPETKLGIIPGYGGTQRLVRELGRARTVELTLLSDSINAADAHKFGLINQVVEPAELMSAAKSLAERISRLAPLAIRACLQAVVQGAQLSLEDGLKLEAGLFAGLFATNDMREGTRAFLEKREARFTGR